MKNTLKKHEFKQIIESMPNALIVFDESGEISLKEAYDGSQSELLGVETFFVNYFNTFK
jgi:hypothetical protein